MPLFSHPAWLICIIVLSQFVNNVASVKQIKCVFSSKTRSKQHCYGRLSECDSNLARVAGVSEGTRMCIFIKTKLRVAIDGAPVLQHGDTVKHFTNIPFLDECLTFWMKLEKKYMTIDLVQDGVTNVNKTRNLY